jgi:hypothetical protein
VEFSPQRGRNVLIFSDKQLPLSIAYPLPDRYVPGTTYGAPSYEDGVNNVLHLIYIENRNAILAEASRSQASLLGAQKSPVSGALVDSIEPDPVA